MDVEIDIKIDGVTYDIHHEVKDGTDVVKFANSVRDTLDYHLGVKEARRYIQEMYN